MNTIISAAVAAVIIFISSITTLFVENPELTFAMVKQSSWVSIVGGSALAFFQNYQTLTTRRLANKLTGTGDGGI